MSAYQANRRRRSSVVESFLEEEKNMLLKELSFIYSCFRVLLLYLRCYN